ncbi:MAG: hypothetical protein JXB85_06465 [Anaerolineales bacterium]|nr:hypothetical protein [Anaerolineales bacterium]
MNAKELFHNQKFKSAFIFVLAFTMVFFLFNVFVIGGSNFISQVDSLVSPLAGGIACWLLARLLAHKNLTHVERRVYRWIMVGLILWVVADAIWAVYVILLNVDMPYPSWADFFWLSGYPFFYFALLLRIRSFGTPLRRGERWFFGATVSAVLLMTFLFIMPPIVRDYDSGRLLESVLNLTFPLADLFLLVLILVIVFALEKESRALSWQIFAAGVVAFSVSNLLFSYISWQGLYYPDGQANFLSTLVDFAYNILYFALGFAFYSLHLLLSTRTEIPISGPITLERQSVPNMNFAVFTDRQNRIMSVSENLLAFLKIADQSSIRGKRVGAVLGVKAHEMDQIFLEMAEIEFVSDRKVTIRDPEGRGVDAWLTAFPTRDLNHAYTGANLVLRICLDASSNIPTMSRESLILAQNILNRAGVLKKEKDQIRIATLQAYFIAKMEQTYRLVSSESSPRIAAAMEMSCQKIAQENGWPINFRGGKITIPESVQPGMLECAIPALIAQVRESAVRVVGEDLLRKEYRKLDRSIDETLDVEILDSMGLRK